MLTGDTRLHWPRKGIGVRKHLPENRKKSCKPYTHTRNKLDRKAYLVRNAVQCDGNLGMTSLWVGLQQNQGRLQRSEAIRKW